MENDPIFKDIVHECEWNEIYQFGEVMNKPQNTVSWGDELGVIGLIQSRDTDTVVQTDGIIQQPEHTVRLEGFTGEKRSNERKHQNYCNRHNDIYNP